MPKAWRKHSIRVCAGDGFDSCHLYITRFGVKGGVMSLAFGGSSFFS